MATTTPNFGWPVPTSTDLVKDGATAIEALGDAIDASLVDLEGGTTGQILAKASNADMDFTWTSPNPGDITAVTAGTGISGGGTSGDVTITNSMATAIDAKGDLVAGTGADAFARLAVGSNGLSLVADSAEATGLKWGYGNSIGCSIYNSDGVGTTVSNNTQTVLSWNSENWDSSAFHSTSTNTSRITIPTGLGGTYQLNASLLWANSATGIRYVAFRKNGGGTVYYGGQNAGSASAFPASTNTRIFTAVAGDYFEIVCFQTSGGNLTAYNDEIRSAWFEAIYLGA